MRRLLFASTATMLVLAACGDDGGNGGATGCDPPSVMTEGTLTVGAEFPGYAPFIVGEQDNPTGFEGELIDELTANMGLDEDVWVNIAFDQLYAPGAKEFDVGVSEITITDEREEVVDFSESYFEANQGLIVRADSEYASATTADELLDAAWGAEAGTTGLAYIEENFDLTQQVSQFDTTDVTSQALKAGTIDIQIIDVPIAIGIRDGSEDVELVVIGQIITDEEYGLALEQDSPLKECVDDAIVALRDDGRIEALQEEYFPGSVDLPVFEP